MEKILCNVYGYVFLWGCFEFDFFTCRQGLHHYDIPVSYTHLDVYKRQAEGKAKNVGLEILTPAKVAADGGEVIAVVIGKDVEGAAKQAIAFGADKAVVVAGDDYEVYNTDVYTNALVEVVKKYAPKSVFVGATPDGKDLAAKAAAKVGSGCVTNVTGVALDGDKIVYTSPVYAGAVLNDDVCESEIEFALLR